MGIILQRLWDKLLRWAGLKVLLAAGAIPQHIAIIMDGNRRFADRAGIDRKSGHEFGYESLVRTLELCLDLGTRYVTVYAFSIDNFRRSADEVGWLMDLMKAKLEILVKEQGMAERRGIRVQILGNLALLRQDLRKSVDQAMEVTSNNKEAVLNICVAYTSTDEIANAVKQAVAEKLDVHEADSSFLSTKITTEDIERHLYTSGCPPPDLLIRTSGETRLSNFMLWQSGRSYLSFCKVLWPDFSFTDFFQVVLDYQRNLASQRMTTKQS